MPKKPTPEILSSAAVSTLLHMDRSTLTRWVKRGKITPLVRGAGPRGEMFFAKADVDKHVTERSATSP